MSALNEIYPFAIGDGANVEAASVWAGDNVRSTGFATGIASSMRCNTALRQAAFTSAMIAQFTADYQPDNVDDNGDVAEYEAEFVAALNHAIQSLVPAGLLYEGVDVGTQNAAHVASTTPTLTTFPVGGFIGVKKIATTNSGPMLLQVLDKTGPIVWPDGTALGSGMWPASAEALLFYDGARFQLLTFPGPSIFGQLGSGEGIVVADGLINLGFNTLQEEDTLARSDLFAFYQTITEGGLPPNHHRKITWGAMLDQILALVPPCPDVTPPTVVGGGGPGGEIGEFVTQPVTGGSPTSTPNTGNAPPDTFGYSVGMTTSGASLMSGTVATTSSGGYTPGIQTPLNSSQKPIIASQAGDAGGHYDWPINLTGTWVCRGWSWIPLYVGNYGYTWWVYWVRIL